MTTGRYTSVHTRNDTTSMSDRDNDPIALTVRDAASRRRFIRQGAAFIAAGTPLIASGQQFADCDRGDTSAEAKQAAAATSDSDQGATADPAGCGRAEPPVISRADPDTGSPAAVSVDTIRG